MRDLVITNRVWCATVVLRYLRHSLGIKVSIVALFHKRVDEDLRDETSAIDR